LKINFALNGRIILNWLYKKMPMRYHYYFILLLFTLVSCAGHNKLALFNGRNLDDWYTFLEKHGKNQDPDSIFTVKNGLIHISGKEFGYICTKKSFGNFRLVVEFRWGEAKYPPREKDKRDSGIMYHFCDTCSDKVWPTSYECQVQEGDCGDFWLVGGVELHTNNDWEKAWGMKHIFRTENHEKPYGQWNTIEVISSKGSLRHYVNGKLVNEGEYSSVRSGKILIQSEGAEVYYRKIELYPL
jgi:hypothetical protein